MVLAMLSAAAYSCTQTAAHVDAIEQEQGLAGFELFHIDLTNTNCMEENASTFSHLLFSCFPHNTTSPSPFFTHAFFLSK